MPPPAWLGRDPLTGALPWSQGWCIRPAPDWLCLSRRRELLPLLLPAEAI